MASWLSGWNYRRPVIIDNTRYPINLFDYQVLVTVDTASLIAEGKMRSDCGDIRFTYGDGVTLLPYWIESGINTTATKIWVKVPAIPASSYYTIFMYYGNPSAESLSNGDSVFLLFDDFLGTSIDTNKWSPLGIYGLNVGVENGKLKLYGTATQSNWIARADISSVVTIDTPFIVEAYKLDSVLISGNGISVGLDVEDMVHFYQCFSTLDKSISTTPYYERYWDGSSGIVEYNSQALQPHRFKLACTGSYVKWYVDDVLKASDSLTLKSCWVYIVMFLSTKDDQGLSYFDWIFVRKYADPEPTTAVGPEEVPSPPSLAPAWIGTIDELKKRLIFTTTPSFLQLSGSGSINILSPSDSSKTLTVRNWWLITNASGGRITLASPSKLFGSLLAKKQKKTGQEDIWATLGAGEPILLYYQGITPDSKVLVLVSWRED